MGGDNFFSKVASMDPLARALHLPGSDKYAQAVAQRNAGATDVNGGAYTGIAPTLAGANAGYAPGGPGAAPNWQQINLGNSPSGIGGFMTKLANLSANTNPASGGNFGTLPNASDRNQYAPSGSANVGNSQQPASAYVQAARGAAQPQTWSG